MATFNVRHCRGWSGRVDPRRTAAALRDLGADAVALQELDSGMERSGRVHQPDILGRLTGMGVRFMPTLSRPPGKFGIGVLSSAPPEAERAWVLAGGAPEHPRARRHAAFSLRLRGLWFVSTHLSTVAAVRRREMVALAEAVGSLEGPVVVAGDLNASSKEAFPLTEAGLYCATGDIRTFPSYAPLRAVDHVFVSRDIHVKGVLRGRTLASDHLPVAVDIVLSR